MKKDKDEMLHAKHRERMYEKVLGGGADSMHEHELLEMLLYLSIPRVNTNPIAHRLINRFGSLRNVFEAKPHELVSVKGVGKISAKYIANVKKLFDKMSVRTKIPTSYDAEKKQFEDICTDTVNMARQCGIGKVVVSFYDAATGDYSNTVFEMNEIDCRQIVKLSMYKPSSSVIIAEKVPDFSKSVTKPLVPFLRCAGITMLFDFIVTESSCFEVSNGEIVDYIEL